MKLNNIGQMIRTIWNELPNRFPTAESDEFIIMPNHIHGIISIVGVPFMAPNDRHTIGQKGVMNHAPTLGDIVRTFKAVSTRRVRLSGFTTFAWQRNYYERVVRNENELHEMREYIQNNPLKWDLDPENRLLNA